MFLPSKQLIKLYKDPLEKTFGLVSVQPCECKPLCCCPRVQYWCLDTRGQVLLLNSTSEEEVLLLLLLQRRGHASWSPVIFGPLSAYTSSEVSGLFLQLLLVSVMMLYFLNQLYPPVLSSLTLTLHLALLTLRSSDCNFSISAQPHRKCIHPNNHMFSNTQVAIKDV